MKIKNPLGKTKITPRGFKFINFEDYYGSVCSIQESSISIYDTVEPGQSAIWLGVDKATVKIMAKDAAKEGIKTKETTGWVEFPLPEDVLISSRMHLTRDQVQSLIGHLQNWLKNGEF